MLIQSQIAFMGLTSSASTHSDTVGSGMQHHSFGCKMPVNTEKDKKNEQSLRTHPCWRKKSIF